MSADERPVPLAQVPAAVRDLTAARRAQLEQATTAPAVRHLERIWAVGSARELQENRTRATKFVQAWKDDPDREAGRFVLELAEAQNAAHTKSGPARRRREREARRRGRPAPVHQGPDPLAPAAAAEDFEAHLSPLEQDELAAVRGWIRDWDAERPTETENLTPAAAAAASRSKRSAESRQEAIDRIRSSWAPTTASEDLQEPADAPSATPSTGASERTANKVGRIPADHKKPAGHIADRRSARYMLRETLQDHRTTDRLKACGMKTTGGDVAFRVGPSGLAAYAGLQTCASIWSCPICMPKIRTARATELENFAAAWIAHGVLTILDESGRRISGGRGLVMGTFTFSHHKRLRLAPMLVALQAAWKKLQQNKRYRRIMEEHGLAGFTRALELTYGRNGWHPHLHVLFWFPSHMPQATADRIREAFADMWAKACVSAGLNSPSDAHGVDLRTVARGKEGAKQLARYVAKIEGADGVERSMGNEMMRGDLKTGRRAESITPFEIAELYAETGEKKWLTLWLEYERATHGRKALTWSDGLKAMLQENLDIAEDSRTDEEIAETEEESSQTVAFIPRSTWYQHIAHHRGRRLQLLHAYERLGEIGLQTCAKDWGLDWGRDIIPVIPQAVREASESAA